MDDYLGNFKQKIAYILKMVSVYGIFKVPLDWFEISVVANEGERGPKDIIHGYGTTYKIDDLTRMYKDEFDRILKACAVICKKDKKGITFIAKELDSKKESN